MRNGPAPDRTHEITPYIEPMKENHTYASTSTINPPHPPPGFRDGSPFLAMIAIEVLELKAQVMTLNLFLRDLVEETSGQSEAELMEKEVASMQSARHQISKNVHARRKILFGNQDMASPSHVVMQLVAMTLGEILELRAKSMVHEMFLGDIIEKVSGQSEGEILEYRQLAIRESRRRVYKSVEQGMEAICSNDPMALTLLRTLFRETT